MNRLGLFFLKKKPKLYSYPPKEIIIIINGKGEGATRNIFRKRIEKLHMKKMEK
jgi:hypothetical protein